MEKDIVPDLLTTMKAEFDERTFRSSRLDQLFEKLKSKKATYVDVNDFSVEIGRILSDTLKSNISVEILPDGKMYFNVANRILGELLQENYEIITGFAEDVQSLLNEQAGLKLKSQIPEINKERVEGIINRMSSEDDFEQIKWLLDEPIVTFSQSIVDDIIKANIEFQAKVGLQPNLTRTVVGKACSWCKDIAGFYKYPDVPDDVYHRHNRCRCTVDYNPGDGRKQNVWSKNWN